MYPESSSQFFRIEYPLKHLTNPAHNPTPELKAPIDWAQPETAVVRRQDLCLGGESASWKSSTETNLSITGGEKARELNETRSPSQQRAAYATGWERAFQLEVGNVTPNTCLLTRGPQAGSR